MRYLSLFSGMSADHVAWCNQPWWGEKMAGDPWECVGFSEIDPAACAVLAHHYPEVPNLGNIEFITEDQIWDLGQIDLVLTSSPCQNLSAAGNRKGIHDGEESRLFWDSIRIARWAAGGCGLRWIVWENVYGAFSSNKGNDFAAVAGAFVGASVDVPKGGWQNSGVCRGPGLGSSETDGAIMEWRTLNALNVGGCEVHVDERGRGPVPQRRRRIFAVTDLGDWASRKPILPKPESLRRDLKASGKARKEAAPTTGADFEGDGRGDGGGVSGAAPTTPARKRGGGGLGADFDCDGGLIAQAFQERGRAGGQNIEIAEPDTAYALTSPRGGGRQQEGNICVPILEAGERTGKSTDDIRAGIGIGVDRDPMYTLQGGKQHAIATFQNTGQRWRNESEEAQAIRKGNKDGNGDARLATLVTSTGDIAHCLNAGAMGRIDYESETMVIDRPNPGYINARQLRNSDSSNRIGIKPEAFKSSHLTRGKDGAPADHTPPLSERTMPLPPVKDGYAPVAAINLRGCDGGAMPELADAASVRASRGGSSNSYTFGLSNQPTPKYGEDVCLSLDSKTSGGGHPAMVASGFAIRRLVPAETVALMAFPRGYLDDVRLNGKPLSDSAKYKLCGNSIVTHCLRWIKERIEWSLDPEGREEP